MLPDHMNRMQLCLTGEFGKSQKRTKMVALFPHFPKYLPCYFNILCSGMLNIPGILNVPEHTFSTFPGFSPFRREFQGVITKGGDNLFGVVRFEPAHSGLFADE